MTLDEAQQAFVNHVADFVGEVAAEYSLDTEGACRFCREMMELPDFQLWMGKEIARLTGGLH